MPTHPYTTFRITFNENVTVGRVHDWLAQRTAGTSDRPGWIGLCCLEESDDGVFHCHGIVTNKDALIVRSAVRRFLAPLGAAGNDVYSVSAARDNLSALRYACKDIPHDRDDEEGRSNFVPQH